MKSLETSVNIDEPSKLVDAVGLLSALWPEERCRPSLRWLREQQKRKSIPYIKIGRLVYFDPQDVLQVIKNRFSVRSKASATPLSRSPS